MSTIFLKGHLDLETDTDGGQYEDTRGVWHLRQTGAHVYKDRQGLLAARRGWKTQKPLLLSILLWPCVCHTPSVLYCMPKNRCFKSPKGGTY